jgi:hypothetical protein
MEHAPGDTVPQLDNMGDLSDADQVLASDQVRTALQGGCDLIAHTVLLYVLYIPHTVHTVYVPCFPVSDVEVSSSTSVHTLVHT